jgi:hypothetical protein
MSSAEKLKVTEKSLAEAVMQLNAINEIGDKVKD